MKYKAGRVGNVVHGDGLTSVVKKQFSDHRQLGKPPSALATSKRVKKTIDSGAACCVFFPRVLCNDVPICEMKRQMTSAVF